MGKEVTFSPDVVRERVVVFLAFLTSEACREAFRVQAPPEAWAATLCRV